APAGAALLPPQFAARRPRRRLLAGLLVLAAAAAAGLVWWYGQNPEVRRFEGHTERVSGVAFTPDGRHLLTRSWDHTLRLWDVDTGREVRRFEPAGVVRALALSADGRWALSGGGLQEMRDGLPTDVDCDVRLWDVEAGVEVRRFEGHTRIVRAGAFAPGGRLPPSAARS